MKTFALFIFFVNPCLSSLVFKLPIDKKSILTLDSDLQFPKQITFCIRFKFESPLMPTYIFNSRNNALGLWFFLPEYGHVFVNKEEFLFKIPKDFLQPFSWHNFCFNSIGDENQLSKGKIVHWISKTKRNKEMGFRLVWWTPSIGRKVGIPGGILPHDQTELTNWESR